MEGAAMHPLLKPPCDQTSSFHHHTHGDRRDGGRFNLFTEGSLVEVRTNEPDFKDTFFSATVISPAKTCKTKSGKILVEYHSLLYDEEGSEKLKEYVDVSCLRPFPALQEVVEGFDQDDAVDAFHHDGWWIGIVTRVLEGGERKYVVTFQNPPDEREFWFSELRVHWDWVNGSWVRPDRQSLAGSIFDVGRKVEMSFDREDCQDAWFPATIYQDLGNGVYLVEYCSAISDKEVQTLKVDSLHLRPCPPLLKVKNFLVLEKVDAFFDFGWWSGVINKVLENSRYTVFFRPLNMEKEFNQSELRSHMDWKDGKCFTSSQDIKLIEHGDFSEKRKRGRPRKISTGNIQTPMTDDLNKKDDDPNRISEEEAVVMDTLSSIQEKTTLNKEKPINGHSDPKDREGKLTERTSPREHEKKVDKESIRPEETHVVKRGKRRSTSEKVAHEVRDSPGASVGKSAEVNFTQEVNVVCEAPSNKSENQLLANWIEGMHSPFPVDGSRASAVTAVEQCIKNGETQKDNVVLEEVSEKHQETEIQSLPFEKNTFLWKTIESMEIFQKIPQNPHFQPLEHIKESLREGKAIGHMINFSSVVEKICRLQFDDPKSITDDILETLAELEKHGFNVRGVQDRVVELLAVKGKAGKFVDEAKGLNDEISAHHHEKDKIEEEMEEINEQIQKLQEKLLLLELAKDKKDDEIASLGARLKETEEGIKNMRHEFEGVVSSTL